MHAESHQSSSDTEITSDAKISSAPLTSEGATLRATTGIRTDIDVSQPSKEEFEIKLKFGEEIHQYVREYIRLADQKAAFFFAASTAVLTYLNSLGLTTKWITNPITWGPIHVLSFVATACLLAASIFCLLTILPRLGGTKKGIIFFHAICEYESPSEYSGDVMSRRIVDLCDAKFKHTFELSRVCRDKYKSLIIGAKFGAVGLMSAFLLFAIK